MAKMLNLVVDHVLYPLSSCRNFQGKYEEAEPLYRRASAINEAAYGPLHPRVAADLNNRAGLLSAQARAFRHFWEYSLGIRCLWRLYVCVR